MECIYFYARKMYGLQVKNNSNLPIILIILWYSININTLTTYKPLSLQVGGGGV